MKEDGKKRKKKVAAKKSKAKKSAKDAKPSFLKRLLKRDGDSKKRKTGDAAGSAPAKKKPLTPLERSIAEIRQLQKVGERDPERLATLLANILAKEKAKHDEAKEKFDAMVWDIVHREEQGDEDEGGDESGDAASPGDDTDDSSEKGPRVPPDPSHN